MPAPATNGTVESVAPERGTASVPLDAAFGGRTLDLPLQSLVPLPPDPDEQARLRFVRWLAQNGRLRG